MARSAARRIIDEQRKTPRATTQHMTHDRDCTNVQGLLSKRSTPCQLYRRCTDKVAWRGGSRKQQQQQSKRKHNSPGVPHQKEYPCQLYRAKAKVTGRGLFMRLGGHVYAIPKYREKGIRQERQNPASSTHTSELISSLLIPSWRGHVGD